ncbi:MAG: DUF4830 domain-containing protein [Oscillospiraceae bacterium]
MRWRAFRVFSRRPGRPAALLLLLLVAAAGGHWAVGLLSSGEMTTAASIRRQAGKSETQRQEFLSGLGWQIEPEPCEVAEVVIPKEFDEVYQNYNVIQLEQGMGLEKYRGKRCKRYTYVVHNHPSQAQSVRANLLVMGGKIIGGDVSSLGMDSFMQGLAFPEVASPNAPPNAASYATSHAAMS